MIDTVSSPAFSCAKLTLRKASLFIGASWIAITGGIASAQVPAADQAAQQSSPLAPAYAFEAVSVRPNDSHMDMARYKLLPDGFTAENLSLGDLVGIAFTPTDGGQYHIFDDRLIGMPGWAKDATYNVEARISEADIAAFKTKAVQQQMLRALLADRFHLKVHLDTRELPIVTLTLAPGGPKLKPAPAGETYANGIKNLPNGVSPAGLCFVTGQGEITGQGASMGALVGLLSSPLIEKALVIDKTGVTGNYDFKIKWSINESTGRPFPQIDLAQGTPASPDTSGISLAAALQEQLGLKLLSTHGAVEVLVIDHIERPTPN